MSLINLVRGTTTLATTGLAAYAGFEAVGTVKEYVPCVFLVPEVAQGLTAIFSGLVGGAMSSYLLDKLIPKSSGEKITKKDVLNSIKPFEWKRSSVIYRELHAERGIEFSAQPSLLEVAFGRNKALISEADFHLILAKLIHEEEIERKVVEEKMRDALVRANYYRKTN